MRRWFSGALIIDLLSDIRNRLMSLQDDFTALTAKVAAVQSVDQSAIVLLQGLKAQLDALAAQPTITSADVQALSAQLDTSNNALAAAVTANTPAAPPSPAPAPAPSPAPATPAA